MTGDSLAPSTTPLPAARRRAGWSAWLAGCLLLLGGCDEARRDALRTIGDPAASPSARVRALRVIQQSERADGLELVADQLAHPSARVRLEAVRALAKAGSTEHLQGIVPRLEDESLEVRLAAIVALGQSPERRMSRFLLPYLEDPNARMREATARALNALGLSPVDQRVALAARQHQEQVRALGSPNEQTRADAAEQLGESGSTDAVEPLVARLADPSPNVKRAVARALGQLGGDKARRALEAALSQADEGQRLAAAIGVVALRPPAWSLLSRLLDPAASSALRREALDALAALGPVPDPSLRPRICAALGSSEPQLALAAARVVAEHALDCGEARASILGRWSGLETAVAGDSLAELPDDKSSALLGALACERCGAILFAALRRAHALYLRDAMKWIPADDWSRLFSAPATRPAEPAPPSEGGREAALAWLLARYPSASAHAEDDPLLPPVVDGAEVAWRARDLAQAVVGGPIEAQMRDWLAERADASQPAALRIAFLELFGALPLAVDVSASRVASARADAGAGERDAQRGTTSDGPGRADPLARAIAAATSSEDADLRRAGAIAAPQLGRGATKTIIRLLDDPDPEVRDAAIVAAGRLGDSAALKKLLELLQSRPAAALVRALGQIGDSRALEPIARLIRDEHPMAQRAERVLLIESIAAFEAREVVEILRAELSHPDRRVRLAAARALEVVARKHGRPALGAATAELEACQRDFYRSVRQACQAARGS